jgi:SAM-dependent methyltransferase
LQQKENAAMPEPEAVPSLEKIKQGMRATWMAGDFGVIARNITGGAEDFIARLPLPANARVLDVACGTGNTTIPLAKRGMHVTGLDLAPNLLEQARARAAEAGLAADFIEGDAEQLPFADGTFDAVVTMFGAMFAPRPEIVASELARVLKPGGMLAMANWAPNAFTGKMFKIGAKHVPPPAGIPPPVLWGDPATVTQRLAPWFDDIRVEPTPIDFDLPYGPAGVVTHFREYFGPTMVAFSKLDAAGQAAMAADLEALWSGANRSSTPDERTLVDSEYLRVIARKK